MTQSFPHRRSSDFNWTQVHCDSQCYVSPLGYRPVTPGVAGSSPVRCAISASRPTERLEAKKQAAKLLLVDSKDPGRKTGVFCFRDKDTERLEQARGERACLWRGDLAKRRTAPSGCEAAPWRCVVDLRTPTYPNTEEHTSEIKSLMRHS